MRILFIIDSRKLDEDFLKVSRGLIHENDRVGLYDYAGGNTRYLKEIYGEKINCLKKLEPADLEFYQAAFCMYGILQQAYVHNIYCFSYVPDCTETKKVINKGADFLFLQVDCLAEDVAYFNLKSENIAKQIRDVMEKVNQCLLEGEYPAANAQLAEGKTIEIDESLSMEKLMQKRTRTVILNRRMTFILEKVVDLTPYYRTIDELLPYSAQNLRRESDSVLASILQTNFDKILDSGNCDVIHIAQYVWFLNGYYGLLSRLKNCIKEKDSVFYYIQGSMAYVQKNYEECVVNLEKYFELSATEEESEVTTKICRTIGAQKDCMDARIQLLNMTTVRIEELYCLLQSVNTNYRRKIYSNIVEQSSKFLKEENYAECERMIEMYCRLIESVGKDWLYSAHMVIIYENAAKVQRIYRKYGKALKYDCIKFYFVVRRRFTDYFRKFRKKISDVKKNKSKRKKRFNTKKIKRSIRIFFNKMHIYGKEEKKLLAYKGKYTKKRCFVIGNGPSLRIEDLERIRENGDICFASNKIYKVFDRTDWRPDYYACTDAVVFKQNYRSILELGDYPKFFTTDLRLQNLIRREPKNIILNYAMKPIQKTKFNPLATYIYSGGTVTYVLITLAWMMGFREIYLIGCDHNYDSFSSAKTTVMSATNETNGDYFMKNYMRPGEVMNVGNLGRAELGYIIAKKYIESHGGKLYNATRGGKLEVLPRADLDKLLEQN